jgi:hypothetical protein
MATAHASRPVEPRPQDFGLSAERAKKLETPFAPGWRFWVPYIGAFLLVLGDALPASPQALGKHVWLIPLALLVALIVVIKIPFAAATLWARSQKDYRLYQQYQEATFRYQTELGVWERQQREWERRQREWWLRLDGRSLEVEADTVFSRRGYGVRRVGKPGDQGVDLLLTKDGLTIPVQCKAHRTPVGPSAVRDLYGSMVHHGYREAWLLSTSGFTKGAHAFALGKSIRLLTVDDML